MQFPEKLWKMSEEISSYQDIKLITTEARRNYFVSEADYDTTKSFSKDYQQ